MRVESTLRRYAVFPLVGILSVSYLLMYPASMLIALSGESTHPQTLFFCLFSSVSILYSVFDYVRHN